MRVRFRRIACPVVVSGRCSLSLFPTDAAQPGDIIDFTLQFNNIGNEPIGNVTIIDNLTTRLQYVADSEASTRKAKFVTQTNAGDSLVLRWEILDPVPAGEGGTIRFKCRVR